MLGLYIHVPFCAKICDYCDFSAIITPNYVHLEYLNLINKEILHFIEHNTSVIESVETIYIGGGTPSIFSKELLERFFLNLKSAGVPLYSVKEFTMEFNPESCEDEKISLAKEYGVNRISLGIQTFNEDLLNRIGRFHKPNAQKKALDLLIHSKDLRVNADLMFNLPSQTLEQFINDLNELSDYPIGHISFYGLKIDPNTRLGHRVLLGKEFIDEDLYASMYKHGVEILSNKGFERYETSNFARIGFESLHNQNYWNRGEYISFGPGSHSFFKGVRYHAPEKYAPWRRYIESGFPITECTLDPIGVEQEIAEIIQLSLRTKWGLNMKLLLEKGFYIREKTVLKWENLGYLQKKDDFLILNGDGWIFMDKVVEDLYCNCIKYSKVE